PPCNAVGGFCTPQVLDSTQPDADAVLVAGDLVYYTTRDSQTIRVLRYDGTGAKTFQAAAAMWQIAADSANLYITDFNTQIHEMPLGGGNIGVLASLATGQTGYG